MFNKVKRKLRKKGKKKREGVLELSALTRDLNIPFVVRESKKAIEILNKKPSPKQLAESKKASDAFAKLCKK